MRIDSRVAGRFVAVAFAVAAAAAPLPAFAQNEGALRAFFEGKPVALRIDMPGSSDGVDVFPNDLRDDRERQNRRIEAERVHLQEMQRERVASQRLQGRAGRGSTSTSPAACRGTSGRTT